MLSIYILYARTIFTISYRCLKPDVYSLLYINPILGPIFINNHTVTQSMGNN